MKANWLERRLKTALTGFVMDYTDLQQTIMGLDPNTPFAQVVNANAASIKGVELETEAVVSERFRITAAGTWLDARYDDLKSHDPLHPELGTPGPTGVNVRDLSGNRLVRAPEWQVNFSGEYSVPLRGAWQGVLRASYAWQDRIYFQFFNNEAISQGNYGLLNLSAALEDDDGNWQLLAFVNNATDQYYRSREDEAGLAPVRHSVVVPGLPRMYGVSLSHRF